MVGQTPRRIAGMIGTAAAATLVSAFPAAAQDAPQTRPDAKTACPSKPVLEGASPERDAALSLPAEWAGFAAMSMNWLAVRTKLGSVHCVETTWAIQADNFERLDERFLGYEWSGYEAGGYMLIDTAGAGSSMDTGAKPVFSPEDLYLATVQFSDAGWGGFEGFAVWSMFASGLSPVHVDTNLPTMADWRIDKWEGNGCLHLSAIPYERIEDWQKLAQYARDRYIARSRDGWKLRSGEACTGS